MADPIYYFQNATSNIHKMIIHNNKRRRVVATAFNIADIDLALPYFLKG